MSEIFTKLYLQNGKNVSVDVECAQTIIENNQKVKHWTKVCWVVTSLSEIMFAIRHQSVHTRYSSWALTSIHRATPLKASRFLMSISSRLMVLIRLAAHLAHGLSSTITSSMTDFTLGSRSWLTRLIEPWRKAEKRCVAVRWDNSSPISCADMTMSSRSWLSMHSWISSVDVGSEAMSDIGGDEFESPNTLETLDSGWFEAGEESSTESSSSGDMDVGVDVNGVGWETDEGSVDGKVNHDVNGTGVASTGDDGWDWRTKSWTGVIGPAV